MPLLRKKRRDRRVFVWLTDTHGGKKTGLLNPATVLIRVYDDGTEEEWKPELSQTQRWLWSVYEECIGELEEYAGDDELLVAHAGDVTHGDKHGGNIPDTTREDQRVIACDNFRPIMNLPTVSKVRLLTGTDAHVPEHPEARVAARLRNETSKDIRCCHHARFDMGHDVIDGSHHGPYPGSRDWLKGNVALYYLKDRVYIDRRAGTTPARLYMRGHYHHFVHVTLHDLWRNALHVYDLVIIPALAGLDGFVRKVANSPPILQAGMVALEFVEGRLTEIKPFVHEVDLRTEERL